MTTTRAKLIQLAEIHEWKMEQKEQNASMAMAMSFNGVYLILYDS